MEDAGNRVLKTSYRKPNRRLGVMKISVAAVQMESRNGDFEGNVKRAEEYILEAVKKGARLISLPEFALAGYIYADSFWEEAEPLKGRTYQWLQGLCNKYQVYVGTCILESDKEDFFSTFILCGPNDRLWSHRKVEPAAFEAFFFKGAGPNNNVFDTPIGKIGIIICFDSSKTYCIDALVKNRPDLLLLQYSLPAMPTFLLKKDKNNWIETFKNVPIAYAKHLRTPVVSCNKTGSFSSPMPLCLGIKYKSEFVDQSTIVDRYGAVLSVISKKPGVICGEVEIGEKISNADQIVPQGRWYLPYNIDMRFITEFTQKTGKIRYKYSSKRKRAAVL
jgi:predicted amidohydrolase